MILMHKCYYLYIDFRKLPKNFGNLAILRNFQIFWVKIFPFLSENSGKSYIPEISIQSLCEVHQKCPGHKDTKFQKDRLCSSEKHRVGGKIQLNHVGLRNCCTAALRLNFYIILF